MSSEESLALYGDAVAVGSELCDALMEIASGPEFVQRTRGLLDSVSSWAFDATGQAVTITKRGTSFGDYENQFSLSASGGTQIIVEGEEIAGMNHIFDMRYVPSWVRYRGTTHPSDFREAYDGGARIGKAKLSLGTLLDWAVGLDAGEFDETLNRYVPDAAFSRVRSAHFGDTIEDLGQFSVTAIRRESGIGRRSIKLSRGFTLQLLPEDLVFDTEEGSSCIDASEMISDEFALSIKGGRFGERKLRPEAKRVSHNPPASVDEVIGYTAKELQQIHRIGRSLLLYVAGYAAGYAKRYETGESSVQAGKMYTRGFDAGRKIFDPNRGAFISR